MHVYAGPDDHTDMRCDVEPNLLLLLLLAHARLWQIVSIAVMSSVCGGREQERE